MKPHSKAGRAEKERHRKTTKLKRRKEPTAARRRGSSAADLQKQLDQRTRELAEARRHLAEALEQQTATSEILGTVAHSSADVQSVLDTICQSDCARRTILPFGVRTATGSSSSHFRVRSRSQHPQTGGLVKANQGAAFTSLMPSATPAGGLWRLRPRVGSWLSASSPPVRLPVTAISAPASVLMGHPCGRSRRSSRSRTPGRPHNTWRTGISGTAAISCVARDHARRDRTSRRWPLRPRRRWPA
jgi:hypothetical protein